METLPKNMTSTNSTHPDGGQVIDLTEAAITKIKSMMEKDGKTDFYLRIGVVTGGCAGLSYEMSFQKKIYDNDLVHIHGGLQVAINQDCVPFLKGVQVDYIDTLKESGFKYRNPNAKSSCGCGTSFS